MSTDDQLMLLVIGRMLRYHPPMPWKSRYLLLIVGGVIVLGIVLFLAVPQIVVAKIRGSHIESNAPSTSDFDAILARDLAAWFARRQGRPAVARFELLRRGPTQSGAAYPKYYVWVEVDTASASAVRGAVRVAAVERDRFEVLQFLSAEDIRERPDAMQSVFPAALIPEISRRAMQP